MSLGSILVRLTMDTATFETDAGRAAKIAEKRAKEIDASFKRAGVAIGTALAGAAIGITAALRTSIDSMDEMSKSAQKVGVTTEEFSKLTYAAGLADVSMETLVGSLGKLTKSQAAALSGTGQQAEIFKALGIAVTDADGRLRQSSEVLSDFADRFRDMKGSPEAMAAGFAIFGRSFQEMIPLLKDGGDGIRAAGDELEAFGGVLSTEAGKNAEEFNDNLTRLQVAARSLAMQVASDLLPDLVALTSNWVQLSKDGGEVSETARDIADGLRVLADAASLVGGLFGYIGNAAKESATAMAAAFSMIGNMASLNFDQAMGNAKDFWGAIGNSFTGRSSTGETKAKPAAINPGINGTYFTSAPQDWLDSQAIAKEVDRRKAAAAWDAKIRQALGGGTSKSKGGAGGKSEAQREAEQLDASYERLKASLNETYALFGANTEAAKMLYETQNGELAKLSDLRKQELIQLAERNDAQKLANELQTAADKAAEKEADRVKQALKDNEDLLTFMRADYELLGMSNKEREREFALRQLNLDATKEQIAAVIQQSDLNFDYAESLGKQVELMDSVRDAGANFFTDYLSGAKSFKDAMMDAFDSIHQKILQMISDNLMDQLFGKQGESYGGFFASLFGNSSGGGNTGGTESGLSGLMSLFKGGGWGFADGGLAPANSMFQVNERGFEMATVGGRDYMLTGKNPVQITPNNRLNLGDGGVTQHNQFIFAAPTSQRTQEQVAQRTGFGIAEAQRRNGR